MEASILIGRPLEEVWACAGDYANDRRWRAEVREIRYLSAPPIGVGTRLVEVARLVGRRLVTESRISAYEPLRELAFESVQGPYVVRGSRRFAAEDGGSRLTYQLTFVPATRLDRWLEPLVDRLYQRTVRRYLRRLKRILEVPNP